MNQRHPRTRIVGLLLLGSIPLVAWGSGCSGAAGSGLGDPSPDGGGGSSGASSGTGSGGASSGTGSSGGSTSGGTSSGGSSGGSTSSGSTSSGAGSSGSGSSGASSSGAPGDDASTGGDGSTGGDDGSPGDDGSAGDSGVTCPPIKCLIACPFGNQKNGAGCTICSCNPAPDAGNDAGRDSGGPCMNNGDCDGDLVCAYLAADGCSAKGTCVDKQAATCNAISLGCACDGSSVNTICNGLPEGYVSKPLRHTGGC